VFAAPLGSQGTFTVQREADITPLSAIVVTPFGLNTFVATQLPPLRLGRGMPQKKELVNAGELVVVSVN
jgi:hypothetical protein